VFDAKGNLVKNAAQVQSGDEISARLARGRIQATVKQRESGT
jgi:exonuclease VII large subunit